MGVAGAVWSLRSSLIPREAFCSFPERNERRMWGRQRTWKILSAEGHTENIGEGRDGEHRRPTNRRGLTDVATPYVTFIADALPPRLSFLPLTSLLLNGRKKRSYSFYVLYRRRIASYFSFFHFRHRQIRIWRCSFSSKMAIDERKKYLSSLFLQNCTNVLVTTIYDNFLH